MLCQQSSMWFGYTEMQVMFNLLNIIAIICCFLLLLVRVTCEVAQYHQINFLLPISLTLFLSHLLIIQIVL